MTDQGGQGAPRVVLLARSLTDEVRSAALAHAASGSAVTVVLATSDAVRSRSRLGPVAVVRVPVVPVIAAAPPSIPLIGARDLQQEQAASLREAVRLRRGGRPSELRRQVRRVRARLGRRGPSAVDRLWARLPVRRHDDLDLEVALGPVVDALAPAVVLALDVTLEPVAAAARARLGIGWQYSGPGSSDPVPDVVEEPAEEPRPLVLAVGPANSAGQGWAWTQAVSRAHPSVGHHVLARRNAKYDYPADELVSPRDYVDPCWSLATAERASAWTHALLEAGRPLLGTGFGRDMRGDLAVLARLGVRTGLVFHGSEVRDPRRHAATHEFSPFRDPSDESTRRLQARCDALLPLLDDLDVPMFVSTADQLAYVPHAQWLPVVVDTSVWTPQEGTLERPVPLVVHAPSTPWLKGTDVVRSVLEPLADKGFVDFRLITGMQPAEAAALVRSADVVIDQMLLGLYGVLACEGLASGRVVLGHVGDDLRARVGVEVPVVEVTPVTLAETMERVLDDRDWARAEAARGPAFVSEVHDGRRSVKVLEPFLGLA